MFVFPAFIDPTFPILALLLQLGVPILIVVFFVWHIRKLNRIEKMLNDIKEKLK